MQDLASIWDSADPSGSLIKYAEALNEHARSAFLEAGTHVQILFLFKPEGLGGVLPVTGPVDREATAKALKQHIRDEGIYGVIHIAEAWAYLPKRKNDHTFKQIAQGEMRVTDLKKEDQSEVLMLYMSSREGASRIWLHPIVRHGEKAELGEVIDTNAPAGGLFGRLFG